MDENAGAANDREQTRTLLRGLRMESIVAVCALLVSGFAMISSWWQTRVIAQQLSAQVWPYVSISTTYSPAFVAIDVSNDGLGPAIVRSAVLSVDRKPIADPRLALGVLIGHHPKPIPSRSRDLNAGVVVRPGEDLRIVELDAAWVVPLFAANAKRANFAVCYCSLLGNCWIASMQQSGDPEPVSSCPSVGADQYRVPVTRAPLRA